MNLDVLIPSLLLPASTQKLVKLPRLPSLEKLMARADRKADRHECIEAMTSEFTGAAEHGATWLCRRWGLSDPYPIAPLIATYDGFDTTDAAWMFAEPVNMTADRDTVRLSLANSLQLDEQESHELVAALNAHFAIDGLQFFAPFGDRWYVRFSAAEIPETTSPEVAQFKSLADMQPRSYGTLNWRAIQNEAQMLLFTHPVNEARERQGRAVVSGVWFWGGGVRPLLERTPYTCVIARDPLSLQLAAQSGATTLPFSPDSLALAGTDSLLIIPSCAEAMPYFAFAWVDEMTALETIWFQRLSKLLAEGHIEKLNLILPASGTTHTFHATHNNHRLRFWRSTKPLAAYA